MAGLKNFNTKITLPFVQTFYFSLTLAPQELVPKFLSLKLQRSRSHINFRYKEIFAERQDPRNSVASKLEKAHNGDAVRAVWRTLGGNCRRISAFYFFRCPRRGSQGHDLQVSKISLLVFALSPERAKTSFVLRCTYENTRRYIFTTAICPLNVCIQMTSIHGDLLPNFKQTVTFVMCLPLTKHYTNN